MLLIRRCEEDDEHRACSALFYDTRLPPAKRDAYSSRSSELGGRECLIRERISACSSRVLSAKIHGYQAARLLELARRRLSDACSQPDGDECAFGAWFAYDLTSPVSRQAGAAQHQAADPELLSLAVAALRKGCDARNRFACKGLWIATDDESMFRRACELGVNDLIPDNAPEMNYPSKDGFGSSPTCREGLRRDK